MDTLVDKDCCQDPTVAVCCDASEYNDSSEEVDWPVYLNRSFLAWLTTTTALAL